MSAPRARIVALAAELPDDVVTTDALLARSPVLAGLPLARLTGIRERRWARPGEQSLHLAVRAAQRCLVRASVQAADVDLVISASISRNDGPGFAVAIEPATACDVAARIGAVRARCFDVGNACAGFFTAILAAQAYLTQGAARRVLVVSGEHVTHLAESALAELSGLGDPLLASLTLGDAGAAVLLERSGGDEGFVHLDLFTRAAWATACTAQPSLRAHGGALLRTDALAMAEGGQLAAARHTLAALDTAGWDPDEVDMLVPHQTSRATLLEALRSLDAAMGRTVCPRERVLDVLASVGNTTSTSHVVALALAEAEGRLDDAARIAFAITGSGLTIGTALYERAQAAPRPSPERAPLPLRVGLVGASFVDGIDDTVSGSVQAIEALLSETRVARGAIGLIVFAGLLRSDFVHEPATAALVAGRVGLSPRAMPDDEERCLALDLTHGGGGLVDAIEVTARLMIERGDSHAIVVCAEHEPSLALAPSAGALLLARDERAELRVHRLGADVAAHARARRTSARQSDRGTHAHREHAEAWPRERARLLSALAPRTSGAVVIGPSDAPSETRALAASLDLEVCVAEARAERGSTGCLESLVVALATGARELLVVDAAPGLAPAALRVDVLGR